MVNGTPQVVVISNDTVPGSSIPTAAPGLRAFGIAEGLRSHDIPTEIVVDRGPQSKVWNGDTPAPSQPGTVSLPPNRLMDYLRSRAPIIAILTNSNQADHLQREEGITFIVDFFAPKMLELAYQHGEDYPTDALSALRERKLRAIALGDAFIVNGRKKLPYFLAWLLQGQRDIRSIPVEVVNMPVPNHFRPEPNNDPVRFGMAGYLQGWSKPAAWIESVLDLVDRGEASLDVLAPPHWGQSSADLESQYMDSILNHEGVTSHGSMTLSEYQEFVSGVDVVLDVFEHTLEREYAMVTRTVTALACGRPVVHPGFTEVTPFIRQNDAGWIVDPTNTAQIEAVLESIVSDKPEIERKAANARTAWKRTFSPHVATQRLADLIHELQA